MNVPAHLLYSSDHEWFDPATGRVGVTAFAAESLGDIVYLDLPEPGTVVAPAHQCGEIESTKSVSELYAPAAGIVLHRNDSALADPGLVNADPFGEGWLYQLRIDGPVELLEPDAYAALIGG
jgi:glycine cleavage system H protein